MKVYKKKQANNDWYYVYGEEASQDVLNYICSFSNISGENYYLHIISLELLNEISEILNIDVEIREFSIEVHDEYFHRCFYKEMEIHTHEII